MAAPLELAHFGLRTTNLERAIAWYREAIGAEVRFRNDIAAFMSFDDEHHRFVLWDDGETGDKPAEARGVDHVGFSCGQPSGLAEHYERLKQRGILPDSAVNHHFTTSLYYHDPDGNEVELTCDNFPSKAECTAFMGSAAMADAMHPPLFGVAFDPDDLVALHHAGASERTMAAIGLTRDTAPGSPA